MAKFLIEPHFRRLVGQGSIGQVQAIHRPGVEIALQQRLDANRRHGKSRKATILHRIGQMADTFLANGPQCRGTVRR